MWVNQQVLGKETNMSTTEKELEASNDRNAAASTSRRAAALAERIERGAALLAEFAQGLSDKEWQTPVTETDHRPIGVIVHHVASMYPIEIEAARAIAGGNPVTDVSWDAIATLNAKHAQEQSEATKQTTLELLRRNSQEAANAVRTFTD